MPNHKLPFLFLFLGAPSFAQQTASISGTVTNSVTGAPVARAHVSVQNNQGGQEKRLGALTDGNGSFTVTGLDPGFAFVMVERAGFARSSRPQNAELKAGESRTGVDLKLVPTGGITGTVFDPEGQPVQLADVVVQGSHNITPTRTDNRGHYRVGGLDPGKYHVKASIPSRGLPPEIRTDGTQDVRYPPVYFGGASTAKAASWVTVEPGQDAQSIDVRLAGAPIYKVSGRVLNAPAGQTSLEMMHWDSPTEASGEDIDVAPDGSFVIWGLDPGEYFLTARAGNVEGGPRSAPAQIEAGTANIEGLELRLIEPFEISGHIQFEEDQTRAKAPADPNITLQPVTRDNTVQATMKADSSFRIEKVPPGRYRVEVDFAFNERVFVKSLQWGSVQTEGNTLDAQNGPAGAELTVVLSANVAHVSGTVTDSNGPVAGAQVGVLRDGEEMARFGTDEARKYTLPGGLEPGSYSIVALGKDGELDPFNADLEQFEEWMVKLEVHEGDNITQDLKLAVPPK